jgi:hypothetical protein
LFEYIRYKPIAAKAFQTKMKLVEDEAKLLWLPGGHSRGPGEDGEVLPDWVKIFHRYFEERLNAVSRTERQEQARIQIRTMQRTILALPEALGANGEETELRTEVAAPRRNNLTSLNSSVAPGGTLTVEPVVASGTNATRNVRRRTMNAPASSVMNGTGRSMGNFLPMVELLNMNTRSLMQRSIREMDADYERTLEKLERAEADGDERRINWYESTLKKLQEEFDRCNH